MSGSPQPEPQSETARLLAQVRAGDKDAWRKLDERTRRQLEHLLRGRIPASARAQFETEDLLQSTYMRALKSIHTFKYDGPGSFQAWLNKIFVNRLNSRLRAARAQRRDVMRERPLSPDNEPQEDMTPSEIFARAESEAKLLTVIAELPEQEHAVVSLHFLQRVPLAEVARRLSIPYTTATRLRARALESIQRRT